MLAGRPFGQAAEEPLQGAPLQIVADETEHAEKDRANEPPGVKKRSVACKRPAAAFVERVPGGRCASTHTLRHFRNSLVSDTLLFDQWVAS